MFHHSAPPHPTAAWSASPSFAASSADSSTTSLPPPSNGTRITMPRPSLVTSSGPSPVRGFIAAMLHPLPQHKPHANRAGQASPATTPDSNNRVDPSPYYPVFGRRMVMISYARRLPNLANRCGKRACGDAAQGFEHDTAPSGSQRRRVRPRASWGPVGPDRTPNTRGAPRRPASPSRLLRPARLRGACALAGRAPRPVTRDRAGGRVASGALLWPPGIALALPVTAEKDRACLAPVCGPPVCGPYVVGSTPNNRTAHAGPTWTRGSDGRARYWRGTRGNSTFPSPQADL